MISNAQVNVNSQTVLWWQALFGSAAEKGERGSGSGNVPGGGVIGLSCGHCNELFVSLYKNSSGELAGVEEEDSQDEGSGRQSKTL